MEKFALGDIKILICTNIVESGLDIQNANTIIIQDVQQFGLAQLYQVLFSLTSSFRVIYDWLWPSNESASLNVDILGKSILWWRCKIIYGSISNLNYIYWHSNFFP